MRTISHLLLAAVAIIAVVCTAAAAAPRTMDDWSPIENTDDPHIQELGQWAVSEENKKVLKMALTFSKVTSGEQKDIAGVEYRRLHIDASRYDVISSYTAVVIEQVDTRKLVSFWGNQSCLRLRATTDRPKLRLC
uniref:Cystatin domain-containing protein n=1 Tax=Leersia perrieri TaxID=77586 RepID=A0A0D9UZZ6_9ORYZ